MTGVQTCALPIFVKTALNESVSGHFREKHKQKRKNIQADICKWLVCTKEKRCFWGEDLCEKRPSIRKGQTAFLYKIGSFRSDSRERGAEESICLVSRFELIEEAFVVFREHT